MCSSFIQGKTAKPHEMENLSGREGENTIYDQLKWGWKQTVAIPFLLFGVIDCHGYRMKWQIVTEMVCMEILKVHFTGKETEAQKRTMIFSLSKLDSVEYMWRATCFGIPVQLCNHKAVLPR